MFEQINFTKKQGLSLHVQLADFISEKIENGEIQPGEQLPPERLMQQQTGLSRGTVKRAFEVLIKENKLQVKRGAGTFVTNNINPSIPNKHIANLETAIESLLDRGLGFAEINGLFKAEMLKTTNVLGKVNIAAVDCNLETLRIIKQQLSYIQNINFMSFLLADVLSYVEAENVFKDFDIIFTTGTHFEQLKAFLPQYADKIVKAAVSTDRETLVEIAHLEHGKSCVITKSKRFASIIRNNLKSLKIGVNDKDYHLLSTLDITRLENILKGKDTLILPPFHAIDFDRAMAAVILNFHRLGGEIIMFNYTIERGSLIHIEEKIKQARL